MGRQSRVYSESKIYHIMFRGVNYQDLFEERQDYIKLTETILQLKEEMGFQIYAYCFMTNHVHLVLKEKELRDISLIMKRILTKYSRWYNIKYGRTGALIANRYKSVPVEVDEYFLNLIRYVHQNPIKAGIVKNIEDYKYSSYREYLGKPRITDTEFVMEMIDDNEFKEFHMEMEEMDFEINPSEEIKRTRKINFSREIYIDSNDFSICPPPKYFRLKKDGYVRLKNAYIIKCERVVYADNGAIEAHILNYG